MNASTDNVTNLINARLQAIVDAKLTPVLNNIAQEHAKIKVAQKNIEAYTKQVQEVKAEMFDVENTLRTAFSVAEATKAAAK